MTPCLTLGYIIVSVSVRSIAIPVTAASGIAVSMEGKRACPWPDAPQHAGGRNTQAGLTRRWAPCSTLRIYRENTARLPAFGTRASNVRRAFLEGQGMFGRIWRGPAMEDGVQEEPGGQMSSQDGGPCGHLGECVLGKRNTVQGSQVRNFLGLFQEHN